MDMILLAACIFWLLIVWFWRPAFLALTVDDSFYYIKTAFHVGSGYGPTFDRVNPTNGFHPLWLLLLSGASIPFSEGQALFVRVVLTIQIALVYIAARLLSGVRLSALGYFSAVFGFLLFNFYFAKAFINGQESALQFLFIAVAMVYWWRVFAVESRRVIGPAVAMGALAGLLALSRLEGLALGLILLFTPLIWPGRDAHENLTMPRIAGTLVGCLALLMVTAPYYWWNITFHGRLIPVSAAIRSTGASYGTLALVAGVTALTWLVFGLVLRRVDSRGGGNSPYMEALRFVFPLAIYVFALALLNLFVQGKLACGIWYLPPYLLLFTLALSAGLGWIRNQGAGRVAIYGVVGALALFGALTWMYRLDPASYESTMEARRRGIWLMENTKHNALIAGWDCGITGYFSQRRVMNLDGLINSWDYKINYLDRGMTGRFINQERPVDYISQYLKHYHNGYQGDFRGVDLSPYFVVYARQYVYRSMNDPWKTQRGLSLILSRKPRAGSELLSEYLERL